MLKLLKQISTIFVKYILRIDFEWDDKIQRPYNVMYPYWMRNSLYRPILKYYTKIQRLRLK